MRFPPVKGYSSQFDLKPLRPVYFDRVTTLLGNLEYGIWKCHGMNRNIMEMSWNEQKYHGNVMEFHENR